MNIVDLGLVYGVDVEDDRVAVTMTMTTPTCPVGDYLRDSVRDAVRDRFPSLAAVDVELTFDPPWTPDRMSDAARSIIKRKPCNRPTNSPSTVTSPLSFTSATRPSFILSRRSKTLVRRSTNLCVRAPCKASDRRSSTARVASRQWDSSLSQPRRCAT